ncbi:MAG: hypothetical protein IAF08_09130 [Rhizobacter sp.]|nr:hypothetical protein [Chlorobiales bacterium]
MKIFANVLGGVGVVFGLCAVAFSVSPWSMVINIFIVPPGVALAAIAFFMLKPGVPKLTHNTGFWGLIINALAVIMFLFWIVVIKVIPSANSQ